MERVLRAQPASPDIRSFAKSESERDRLSALSQYQIDGNKTSPSFHRLARLMRHSVGARVVAIALLPELGISELAISGLQSLTAVARDQSLTLATITHGSPLVIANLGEHHVLCNHPLVIKEPYVRSAVGVPIRNQDGCMLGTLNVWFEQAGACAADDIERLVDFADIVADELELHRRLVINDKQKKLLKGIFDNAAVGITVNRGDGSRIAINRQFSTILGYDHSELMEVNAHSTMHPDDAAIGGAVLRGIHSGALNDHVRETRLITKAGDLKWCRISVSRMIDTDEEPCAIAVVEDIDARKKVEQARQLLLGEITHRVKNTLAIIQGIAKQLLRHNPNPAQFAIAFDARIQALSRSHDMLVDWSWQALSLEEIIRQLMEDVWKPYEPQIKFSGPCVGLNSQTTVMLSLVLHELMTNAVKYGALRSFSGKIDISTSEYRVDGQMWLRLLWRETCELEIQRPASDGFGSYLIKRGSKLGLGGKSEVDYHKNGIACRIDSPVVGH